MSEINKQNPTANEGVEITVVPNSPLGEGANLSISVTPKEVKDANSIYELDLDGEFLATPEEVKVLEQKGELDQDYLLADYGEFDNSWRYHRVVKFKTESRLKWVVPTTAKERQEGVNNQELKDKAAHLIVAVRGVPISFQYGLSLTEKIKENGEDKFIRSCQTVELIEHLGDADRKTTGSYPLKTPIKMIYKSKDEPHKLNSFFNRNKHLDLIAERVDPVTKKKETGRRCIDCIQRGEYYKGDISQDNIPKCRPDGHLLFCVFELGIKDTTAYEEDDINNPVTVKWTSIKDAGIIQNNGQLLDRPFIIRLEGLGASQLSKIGNDTYDLPVILPSHIKAGQSRDCYLPDDNVLSTQEFYDWLTDDKTAVDGRSSKGKKGNRIYTNITELYITKLAKVVYTKDVAPVFRPIAVGPDTDYNGLSIKEYVRTAYSILQYEAAIARGEAVDLDIVKLPTTVNNKQLEAASPQVSSTPTGAATEKTHSKSALNAFKAPKSSTK